MSEPPDVGAYSLRAACAPLLAILPFLAIGCGPPRDALVQRCSAEVLSVVTRCELTAQTLTQPRSAFVDGNTQNERVALSATFSVAKGRVTVSVPACDNGTLQVSPGLPASLRCDARLDRNTHRFEIEAAPDGAAEGFSGRLEFRAR